MKILILYYSGVGNTKMVAEKIFEILKSLHEVRIVSIEKLPTDIVIADYDALAIGFPTIHTSPAMPIVAFIEQIEQLQNPVPTFLFTTCGLYSANTLRIFAQHCKKKNIITILSKSYRCAAADGVLIAPFINIWFCHEKMLDKKVQRDTFEFASLLESQIDVNIPRFKLYSILNYPNKFFGQRFKPNIYTYKENCILCGKCIMNCPMQNICKDNEGYPVVVTKNCIHCYRCIHHCPKKALSLSKKHPPSKTLYY
ncbi:EFR1 family ferrodoxin [Oscillospiraceae bacterium PP1C4]